MARPNTQEQRRHDILTAAERLLARHDVDVLRLADVAGELGMTPNAVRYYYRDVEGLVAELSRRADERFYARRLAALSTLDDVRDQLAVTITAGLPSGPDDTEWRVIWRAVHAAGFEFDRRPQINGMYHRQVGLYESILDAGAAAGTFALTGGSRDIARTIMALEDYLGYRIVARDPLFDRAEALRLVRGYAETACGTTLPPTE